MSDVRKWLFILSGFRQHRGASSNGCVDLSSRLSSIYGCGTNRVELDTWHASSRDTAAYVCHLGIKDEPPTVAIFAYSWGCGYGAVRLAKRLRDLNIAVRYAVFCDPIYYGWRKWRAMLQRILFWPVKIVVPSNVLEVWWLRQHVDHPSGHDLVAESPFTVIHDPLVLNRRHADMDNAPEFYEICQDVAAKLFKEHPPHENP